MSGVAPAANGTINFTLLAGQSWAAAGSAAHAATSIAASIRVIPIRPSGLPTDRSPTLCDRVRVWRQPSWGNLAITPAFPSTRTALGRRTFHGSGYPDTGARHLPRRARVHVAARPARQADRAPGRGPLQGALFARRRDRLCPDHRRLRALPGDRLDRHMVSSALD